MSSFTEYTDCYRREVLAPLQQAEAIDIRRKSDAFGEKVEEFRKFFQQKAPFSVPGAELKLEHVSSFHFLAPVHVSMPGGCSHYQRLQVSICCKEGLQHSHVLFLCHHTGLSTV